MKLKKAVLFIHGFAGGPWDYQNIANKIQTNRNYDVFTFTLKNHDKTIMFHTTKDEWIKDCENQMENIINHGYNTIYIISHSMGGLLATHLALKYKEIKKLVLASPAYRFLSFKDDKLDVIGSLKLTPTLLKDYDEKELVGRILKAPISVIKEFMSLSEEYRNKVNQITTNTLIIQGIEDKIVPKESSINAFENISSANKTLILLKDVTHVVFNSHRDEEIEKIILDFFKKSTKGKIIKTI